jgi:disease resistance protein RPM1
MLCLFDQINYCRFLIILDSLWDTNHWDSIKPALPHRYLDHGIVVVTTRSKNIANHCCSGSPDYPVEKLSEYHRQELANRLFFNHFSSDSHAHEARPAVEYCCSVPLALKCVCGVLAGADGDVRMVNQLAIDVVDIMMQDLPDEDEKVMQVVKLCYNYLPSSLKKCFLDLRILPEGYAIKRKRLMRRWIAKGFIRSSGGLSEEELAEGYFDELMSRCVLKPESVHSSGRIKSCTINNVFKDISDFGATSVMPENNQQASNTDPDSLQLCDIQSPSNVLTNVRERLSSKNYTSLTILDLEGYKCLSNRELNNLPEFIQLKFLSLRNTDVSHLPKKIGKLKWLETLDIRQTKINEVPHGIVNLDQLKHFLAGHSHKTENETVGKDLNSWPKAVKVPEGMEGMRALQTLANVSATKASKLLHVVRNLKNLKKLGLVIEEKELNSKPLCISIMMLSGSLRSLSVHDERVESSLEFMTYLCFPPLLLKSLNLKGRLGRLPQWIADQKHLSKLTLSETQLSSDAIKLLGKVESLLCFKLYTNSLNEQVLTLSKGEFKHLRMLVVHCSAIQKIHFMERAAPELTVFKWVFSENQMGKLEGIENLPMLKDVSLIGHVSTIVSHDISYAVSTHPFHKSGLVLEKIEQEIRLSFLNCFHVLVLFIYLFKII